MCFDLSPPCGGDVAVLALLGARHVVAEKGRQSWQSGATLQRRACAASKPHGCYSIAKQGPPPSLPVGGAGGAEETYEETSILGFDGPINRICRRHWGEVPRPWAFLSLEDGILLLAYAFAAHS